MSIEEFKRDVDNFNKVNGKEINRLTEFTKSHKDEAIFLVDIVVSAIKEVRSIFSNQYFRVSQAQSFLNFI